MKVRCRIGWHDWTRWRTYRIRWVDEGTTGRGQSRECKVCGFEQSRVSQW